MMLRPSKDESSYSSHEGANFYQGWLSQMNNVLECVGGSGVGVEKLFRTFVGSVVGVLLQQQIMVLYSECFVATVKEDLLPFLTKRITLEGEI